MEWRCWRAFGRFGRATKVVVMTGGQYTGDLIHAIRQEAFAYFSKPFTLSAVEDMKVKQALAGAPAENDIEVLSARPKWLELRLRCKRETADRILQFLRELRIGLSPDEEDSVAMAFRELLFNAIEHGGKFDPQKTVTITYVRAEKSILYRVRDPGQGFSFDELPSCGGFESGGIRPLEHAEVREQLGMRPGGFGIFHDPRPHGG